MARLPVDTFDLPVDKIRSGYYSAQYFNRTKQVVMETPGLNKPVTMQVFQRRDAVVCGVDEAIAMLKVGSGYYDDRGVWEDRFGELDVQALSDGDPIVPWEPVLTIKGPYGYFAHLESVYLGALARGTKVATNTQACVKAASRWTKMRINTMFHREHYQVDLPVLFFADRFDHFGNQERDGYAAHVGGAAVVATDAQGAWIDQVGGGTMPHALVAVNNRSVAQAGVHFREQFPNVDLIGPVDFNNDCVGDSLEMLRVHGDALKGVRLDTSGNMVDESLQRHHTGEVPDESLYGVNPKLVENVRRALDDAGGEHVKIYVSGGFTPEKIRSFRGDDLEVDGFGVGSSLLGGNFDYTADIVVPEAKNGRWQRETCRLMEVV